MTMYPSPLIVLVGIYFLQAFVVAPLGVLAWRFQSMG